MKQDYSEIMSVCVELDEAISRALKEIGQARVLGFVDIFGGGLVTSLIKGVKMNQANSVIDEIRYLLDDLADLLDANHLNVNVDLDMDNFAGFFDIAFDNFFSDLHTQSKIEEAKRKLEELRYNVRRLMQKIDRM